jgi:hypothetical protein
LRELPTHYFNIAFLMGKPQDLPVGEAQMRAGIALAFVTYVLALALPFGLFKASLQAVIDLMGTALILWVALHQTNRLPRMQQAFGGLCGASAFINLASIPITAFRHSPGEMSFGVLAEFVLLLWGLSLLAHVIRHTFEIKMIFSIFIAYVYVVVWGSLINILIPAPVPATVTEGSNIFIEWPSSELLIVSQTVYFDSQIAIELVALSATVLCS